jgi:sugar (pentulose or hexulose) kinase
VSIPHSGAITPWTGRESALLTRATLEGSAYALRDILEAMRDAGLDVRRLTIVGAGPRARCGGRSRPT